MDRRRDKGSGKKSSTRNFRRRHGSSGPGARAPRKSTERPTVGELESARDEAAIGASREQFCRYLVSARERSGKTLNEIATKTRIPKRSLERLETGEFESLPADVFVRGFLRSYARCVGLDETEAIKRYATCGMTPAPVASAMADELASAMATLESSAGPQLHAVPLQVVESRADSQSSDSSAATRANDTRSTDERNPGQAGPSNRDEEADKSDPHERDELAVRVASTRAAKTQSEATETPAENSAETLSPAARSKQGDHAPSTEPTELALTELASAPASQSGSNQSESSKPGSGESSSSQSSSSEVRANEQRPSAGSSSANKSRNARKRARKRKKRKGPEASHAHGGKPANQPKHKSEKSRSENAAAKSQPPELERVGERVGEAPAARAPNAKSKTVAKSQPRPVLRIDDANPEQAERERSEREHEREDTNWKNFIPPSLLDSEQGSRRGALTLAVIILVIVATLTMSYLMRQPDDSGDGVTRNEPTRSQSAIG